MRCSIKRLTDYNMDSLSGCQPPSVHSDSFVSVDERAAAVWQ